MTPTATEIGRPDARRSIRRIHRGRDRTIAGVGAGALTSGGSASEPADVDGGVGDVDANEGPGAVVAGGGAPVVGASDAEVDEKEATTRIASVEVGAMGRLGGPRAARRSIRRSATIRGSGDRCTVDFHAPPKIPTSVFGERFVRVPRTRSGCFSAIDDNPQTKRTQRGADALEVFPVPRRPRPFDRVHMTSSSALS